MWNWLAKARELADASVPYAIVTVIDSKGSTPRAPGAKLLVLSDGAFFGTIGGGRLEELVLEDAHRSLAAAQAEPKTYPLCFKTGQCCGGSVEVFIEIVGVGPQLYLFGAGHVGQSLCQTLMGTPFTVHLVDEREVWLHAAEVPAAVVKHRLPWRDFIATAKWEREQTYVAVMTHDHKVDLEIISEVIGLPARYIGLIGSRTKWARFQQRLKSMNCDPDALGRVHCPIGLPTGGKAPREVAISIASQLLRVHYEL